MLKSLAEKARKAAAKNTTAAEESKKRKGLGRGKVISKRRRAVTASTATSAGSDGDAEGSEAEAVPSMAEMVGDTEASVAGVDTDLMVTRAQLPCGGPAPEAPEDEPLPSIFGHATTSSSSKGEDSGESTAADDEATSKGRTASVRARLDEVSEAESEDRAPRGRPVHCAIPPLAGDAEALVAAESILHLGKSLFLSFCSFFVVRFLALSRAMSQEILLRRLIRPLQKARYCPHLVISPGWGWKT